MLRLLAVVLSLTVLGPDARAQQSALPKTSPFLPAAGQEAAAATSASETIELAGVTSVGKRTSLVFYDKGTKKNHWVSLGETKEGISVLNYDTRREQAVIKLNGVEKVLTLRKGGVAGKTAGGVSPLVTSPIPPAAPIVLPPSAVEPAAPPPAAVPAVVETSPPAATPSPTSTNPPTPAEVQRKQETEARMLVSDLLEIGMAQRKAYEEAQRKAAEGNTAPANPPPETPKQP